MPSSGRPKKVARKEKSGSAPTKANSNQAKGGAKHTPNVKRSAKPVAQGRALKASSETLRAFDGLSSQKLPERSGSGVALLRSIGSRASTRVSMAGEKHTPLDSISEEAKYVITRLVRGLGSGHDASRQGYAATLVEAILIHKAGLNDVYLLIRDHLATSGDGHKVRTQSGALDSGRLSSTEEKHRMLGRCFGYLALVRAGLLAGSTASSAAARAAKSYRARMESMEQGGSGSVISLATNGSSSSASAASDETSASHVGKIAAAIAKDATFMAGKKEYMRPICGEVLAVLATALPWKTVQRFLLGPYGQLLGGKPSGWDGGLIAAVLALEEAWEASGKESQKGGSSVPGPVVKLRQVLDDSESKPEGHSVVDAFARAAEESFPRVHPAWRRLLWRFARRGVLLPSRAGNAVPTGLPSAQPEDAAAFRRFWGECVESRMLGTGNARERAAALIAVSATLPLCPPGSAVAPVVWSRAAASTIAVATTGPGRARRSARASESLKDASKLALEAVVKSATERAGAATSSTTSSSSSSSSSASADSVDDFASGCMVALATGQGKGAAPAGVVKRAVGALQQLLTGEAIESYGSSVLARIQDPSKTSAERLDALRSAKELVLNLTGRASSAGAAAASASSDDGAVWLGSRQVSPSTLEFIYEALRSMVRLAVFQVDEESRLEGKTVRRCREQLAGLVAELAHRGSAPSDAIESSSPSAAAGADSSAEESAAESDAAPQEPKVQDLIDANARSALSWAGTCHSAIEAGLEGLAGVAESGEGEGGFKPAALVPIPGGSAALRARQIALAVSSAFSEAAGVLDAHGGPAVQQGRRLLLNGAAALSLSALACMVEVQDGSGEGGSDEDSDEEPEAGDLELCAATEDLAVALSKLLLPFLRAAADIEGTETSSGSKTPQKGKGKSKKSKKSPSKAADADAAGAASGVQSKIDAASAALEGAGLGAIGSESGDESNGPGPADSVELPCGDASKWLDGQRVKSADGKQDTFAVVADVVLVLLSRADSLTQEAANAALRSCSSFLSIEGLQTLLAPAESLASGKPMASGEESDDDEMDGVADMEDSSDDDSDDDDDDDEEDEKESDSEQKAKKVAKPAASSGAGAGGDDSDSDSDSDSDLDQMQAEGEAAERAAAFIISTQRNQKRALAQARRARQAFVLRTLGAVEVLLRRVDGTPMSIYFGWPLLHLLLLAMRRAVIAAGDAAASGGRGEAREAQQASMALATRLGSLLRKACRCNGGSKAGWKAVVGDGKEGKEVLKLLVSDSVSCFELSKKSPGTDFLAAACDTAFLYVKAAKTVASAVGVDAEPSTWGLGREAADSLLRSVTEQAGHYLTKAGSKLSLLPVQTLVARSIDGSNRGKGGAASGAGADESEQGGGQDLGFAWRLAPLLSHGSLHGRNDFRREECFKLAYQLCKATADAKAWADLQDMDLRSVAVEVQAKAVEKADGKKSAAGDDATAGVAVSFAQTPFGAVASGLSNSLATTVVASTSSMLRASKKARKRVGDEDKAKVLEAAGGDFDKAAIKPSRLVAAATALRTMLRATSSRKSTEASTAGAAGLSGEEAATLSAASRAIYDGKLGGGALRNAARGCMMMLDGTSESNGKAAVGKKRKRDDTE